MAVGGLADTAHGSAGIHIYRPYIQHTETGNKYSLTLHYNINSLVVVLVVFFLIKACQSLPGAPL